MIKNDGIFALEANMRHERSVSRESGASSSQNKSNFSVLNDYETFDQTQTHNLSYSVLELT